MDLCDRCRKMSQKLIEFCNGNYHFCEDCSKEWYELLHASGSHTWNAVLFEWWLNHTSPQLNFNPSKRFTKQ